MESDFGLSAFFHVALKLINDFVFFLMAFIFSLYGLNICTIIGFFDLFLKKYFCVIGIKKKNIYLVNFKGTFYHTWARLDRDGEEKKIMVMGPVQVGQRSNGAGQTDIRPASAFSSTE